MLNENYIQKKSPQALKIAVLAGRRPDNSESETPRFPNQNLAIVKQQITQRLLELGIDLLICSGACGADLLALEVAQNIGVEVYVILPFEADKFKNVSVSDRPGEWVDLFDELIGNAKRSNNVHSLNLSIDDKEAFNKANAAMVTHAQHVTNTDLVFGIAVWDGIPKESNDTTYNFIQKCSEAGFQLVEIPTI